MTAYDLPLIDSIVGEFNIRIYSSQAALTEPVVDTVLEIGEKVEVADLSLGIAAFSTMKIRVRDDYTTYTEGFWYKILSSGTAYVRILLDDEFYFVGRIQLPETKWDELSLFNGEYIRVCSLFFTDPMVTIMETTTEDWITQILANETTVTAALSDGDAAALISLKGMMSSLLVAAGLNASFSESDVSLIFDASNPDFVFTDGTTEGDISDIRIRTKYYSDPPGSAEDIGYYTPGFPEQYLPGFFEGVDSLLPIFLRNFGLLFRYTYDSSTETSTDLGTSKVELIQRGRAYSGTLDFSDREKRSQITFANEMLGESIRVTRWNLDTNYVWRSYKFRRTTAIQTAPPEYVQPFNMDLLALWGVAIPGIPQDGFPLYFNLDAEVAPTRVNSVDFWDYTNDAYVTPSIGTKLMEEALTGYYFLRFITGFSKITRLYGHMTADAGAGETFTVLNIGRRTSIDDGTGAATFYANKVTLRPMTSEVEIEWFRESLT